jgi:hypothetical protein
VPVTTRDGAGSLGFVASPAALRRRAALRQTLSAGASRVARALTLE